MAYRNGTYVAFHANGTNIPTESDIKYYNALKMWAENDKIDFVFTNSHEKTYAVRDTSSRETLKSRLRERLNNSKNMLLIIGNTTRYDDDWIPFEISYAVDVCKIPLIIVYPGYDYITSASAHIGKWHSTLARRIEQGTVKAIHIPFKQAVIYAAISQFNLTNLPSSGISCYSKQAYTSWGIAIN